MLHGNFFRGPIPEHPTPASRSGSCKGLHRLPDLQSGLCALCQEGIGKIFNVNGRQ